MTKFFLEGNKKRQPADYRVISYYKLLGTINKIRLFAIQRVVKKLREEPTEALEKRLAGLKGCQSSIVRKLVVYFMQKSCNMDLEKQAKFFQSKLGCDVECATKEIDRMKEQQKCQLAEAVEKHALFQKALDEIQELLGKVEKKISQTKHKKVVKKERVKARKAKKDDGAVEEEGLPAAQSVNADESQSKKKIVERRQPKQQAPVGRVKTRYDDRPKPRTEFKKKGRNKHLKQVKESHSGAAHTVEKVNPYLSSNQSTHPSWQAKQQQSKIVPFQGKRIILS